MTRTTSSIRLLLGAALTAAVMLAAVPGFAGHAPARSPDRYKDLGWRAWDPGLKEAKTSKRHVLVDVYTDWCGWCKRMEADVYSRSDVRDYLAKRFVTVKLNAESAEAAGYEGKAYNGRSLAARFKVSGYPTTIFLRPGGDHLANVPGYVPADRFLLLLHYVGDGALDRGVTFDDFVKREAGPQPGSGENN